MHTLWWRQRSKADASRAQSAQASVSGCGSVTAIKFCRFDMDRHVLPGSKLTRFRVRSFASWLSGAAGNTKHRSRLKIVKLGFQCLWDRHGQTVLKFKAARFSIAFACICIYLHVFLTTTCSGRLQLIQA